MQVVPYNNTIVEKVKTPVTMPKAENVLVQSPRMPIRIGIIGVYRSNEDEEQSGIFSHTMYQQFSFSSFF